MPEHQICLQAPEGRVTRGTRQNVNSQEVCNLLLADHQFKKDLTCLISSASIIESSFYFPSNVVQVDLDFAAFGENENRKSDVSTFVESQRKRKTRGISRSFDQSLICGRSPSTLYDNNIRNRRNSLNRILLTCMRQLVSKYATIGRQLVNAKTLGPIIMVHNENEQQPRITQASHSSNRKKNPDFEVTREYSSSMTLSKRKNSKESTGRSDRSISCFSFWHNYRTINKIWEQTDRRSQTTDDLRWKELAKIVPANVDVYPTNRDQRTWTKNDLSLPEDITTTASEFEPPILPHTIDSRVSAVIVAFWANRSNTRKITSDLPSSFDKRPEIPIGYADPKATISFKFSNSNPSLHSEQTAKVMLQGPNEDDARLKNSEPIEGYIESSLRARYDQVRSRALPTPRSPVHTTCAPTITTLSSSDPILDTNGISIQLLKLAVMLYAPSLMSALNALIAQCPQASISLFYSEGTSDALTQIFNVLVARQATPNLQAATILDVSTSNLENYTTNVSSLAPNSQQPDNSKVDASLTTSERSDGTL